MDEAFFSEMAEYDKLQKKFEEIYHDYAKRCGVADSVLWILYSIKGGAGIHTQKELCDSWNFSKQTINSALKQMEGQGLLRLEAADGNRKNKLICLTEKGEGLAEQVVLPLMEAESRALAGFGKEEWAAFLGLTRKYIMGIQEGIEKILEKE